MRAHDGDGRAALGCFQLPAGNARLVAQGAEHGAGLQPRQAGLALDGITRHLAVRALDSLEQARHAIERLRRRVRLIGLLEEVEERRRRPLRGQTEQVQQIPHLDRMHLHRRRRQQEQPLGACLQGAHQLEQRVRAALLRAAGRAPTGVVRLIEDDQIPRLRLVVEQDGRAVLPAHQLAGGQHHGFLVPVLCVDLALVTTAQRPRLVTAQLASVVDRPVEVELFAQLDLPLLQQCLGREDQDPFRAPRKPRLPQQQARLDGLAEAHLVGDKELRQPMRVEPFEGSDLVRPGRDGRCGFADVRSAGGQGRRAPDERPDEPPPVGRRKRGRRGRLRRDRLDGWLRRRHLLVEAYGQLRRQEPEQVPPGGIRHVKHDGARRLVSPQTREVLLFTVHPLRFRTPASVDVDALPVALPAGGRLVEAAGPGDPVAGAILDDGGLLVEDRRALDRLPVRVAGDGDLHVETAAADHPGEQLQGVGGVGVRRRQRQPGEVAFDPLAQRLTRTNRVDLLAIERANRR